MSTQLRQSLRLRSSNQSTIITQEREVTAPKRRTSTLANLASNNARAKTEVERDSDAGDANENGYVESGGKQMVGTKDMSKDKSKQPRKRGVMMKKDEETEKLEIPTKTRRIDPKTEGNKESVKVVKKNDEDHSIGRPRRECVKKATIERYDDLMSGSASSSDVTSSESEVDDSDLEEEIKRAKRQGGKGKGSKKEVSIYESSSESEDIEEETEEEEDEEDEKPAKKTGRSRSEFSSSRSGVCRRKSGIERRQNMEMNNVPVEILRDKKYEVDYDKMVRWEKKSVKMVRDLRELERDRANGGQIMDTLNEFIRRCVKDGRMTEMDEKESMRVTHLHESELEEMNRKKNLTVAQRIKEQVMKEKERVEKEDENEEDEEDDEWEEMEPVDEKDMEKKGEVEVRIENKKKLKAPWKAKWIRQEVNREVRQRCENTHKAHLLSYISHMRHLMALANSPVRSDSGIPLKARALSLLPTRLIDFKLNTKTSKKSMKSMTEEIVKWWRMEFARLDEKKRKKIEGMSENERLDELMETRSFDTNRDAVVLFSSLASHLNIHLRIVARCIVTSKKPKEPSKPSTSSKSKKVDKKMENDTLQNMESITYWCEIRETEKDAWMVFNPFCDGGEEKKKRKERKKKGAILKEEEETKTSLAELRNPSTHTEPYHSFMEKDGPVLYFIAVDYGYGVCDVSSRYVNEKDMISRELRGRRANEEWLTELWEHKEWRVHENIANQEENEWMEKMEKMRMPTTVAAFKDHPLYVLDKDVLKMQIIFPYDTEPIGEINKYKIYPRKYLRPINTPKWYEKMGRQIKNNEPLCGEKQVTNPMSGETGSQGLYGYWQTEPWDGGEVVEGRIPRNEFGNVYLYQPDMIPRGCIYLEPDGIQRVATELGKDFVPAVIAWYYKGGNTIPLIRGAVFIKEDVSELLSAWKVSYKRWKEEERKERSDRCLGRWKKLIKGMLRLAAMRKEFEPKEGRKKGKTLDEEAVEEEQKASWPHKQYGGEMFTNN